MLSAIIPTYNAAPFLREFITCLLEQELQHGVEYIFINDGSTDETAAILSEYLSELPMAYCYEQKNAGYGMACNAGLERAQGEFVAFIDPDDYLDKQYFKKYLDVINSNSNIDIVKYNGYRVDDNGSFYFRGRVKIKHTGRVLSFNDIDRLSSYHPSIFNGIYRREFLVRNDIKFCSAPGACFADAQFLVSLYYSKPRIYIINDQQYNYRIHSNQSIASVAGKLNNILLNWKEEYEFLQEKKVRNYSFYLYRFFHQYLWMCSKDDQQPDKEKFQALLPFTKHKFWYLSQLTWRQNLECFRMCF